MSSAFFKENLFLNLLPDFYFCIILWYEEHLILWYSIRFCISLWHPWKPSFFSVSVHLWRYEGGYPALNEVMSKLRQNKVICIDFVRIGYFTCKRAKNREKNCIFGYSCLVQYLVTSCTNLETCVPKPQGSIKKTSKPLYVILLFVVETKYTVWQWSRCFLGIHRVSQRKR